MGIYDRDYIRDDDNHPYRGGRGGGVKGPRTWSLVTWLIVINSAVLLFQMLILSNERIGTVTQKELFGGHAYLLLTYQFVHADLWHLGLNMLMLYLMGRPLLERLGNLPFLGLYLGAGVLGGLVQVLYSHSKIMGASAAVFGVLFAMITLTPRREVYLMLFFVIPVKAPMWKIGLWLVIFEISLFAAQEFLDFRLGEHGIANLAHLGGAFFGWFWISYFWRERSHGAAPQRRWADPFASRRVIDAEVVEERAVPAAPRAPKPFVSAEIDAILDKISAQGMQSLTEEEKTLLQKSSEKLARRVDGK